MLPEAQPEALPEAQPDAQRAPARRLMVNADDFGMSLPVSQCIVELAEQGRVQSTSCLSSAPHWAQSARLLQSAPASLQRGLHFNLTDGVPLSTELRRVWPQFPSLAQLLIRAHCRALPLQAISAEWQAQWQAFADATGHAPQFVDGHQHVIHLPGVRDGVLAELRKRQDPAPFKIRNTAHVLGPGHAFKRGVIAHSGGRTLQRHASAAGLAQNPALVGVYDFVSSDYRSLMKAWLAALPPSGAMLFCHPGGAAEQGDAIGPARTREAAYLASADFVNDLTLANVTLADVWAV